VLVPPRFAPKPSQRRLIPFCREKALATKEVSETGSTRDDRAKEKVLATSEQVDSPSE
jgi:hypothetical protein